jgi:hypothetical protein
MPHEVKFAQDWASLPAEEIGGAVQQLVDGYKESQSGRRHNFVRNLELYERRSFQGYSAYAYDDYPTERDFDADPLGLVRSAVESAVASIFAPQKPKPQFQTMGATWATRRKAYKLDRICEGIINQRQGRFINVWAFMADAATDIVLQGIACVKVVANKAQKRIEHELRPHPDIFVDPAEGRNPQNFFERAPIDQHEAFARYGDKPEVKLAIEGAKDYEWYGSGNTKPRATKTIEIQYAWRLPASRDKPGKYVAVINGHVVEESDWKAPAPPFVFFVWSFHRDGFWATGVGNEGSSRAEKCGELETRLYLRELLASGLTIYVPNSAELKDDDLALNEAKKVVRYDGVQPPTESTAIPFHEMELGLLQFEISRFWDALGLSEVSAAARREQNISSAIGQITLNDTKAGRQLPKAKRYEDGFVDFAHQYMWRLRELAEDDPKYSVRWAGKTLLREYTFAEADAEDDAFSVTCAPAAALPHDPAGRQEAVQVMYNNKFIGKETARQLMGWPDIDNEMSLDSAELEYVDMLIERYLDADKESWTAVDYEAPEGFITNKLGAVRRFAAAWFRARVDSYSLPVEEKQKADFNLGLLTRWIKEMSDLIEEEAAKAAELQNPQLMAAKAAQQVNNAA